MNDKPSRTAMRRQLRTMARRFADEVVALLDDAGFWDEPEPPSEDEPLNRRVRRTGAALDELADRIESDLQVRKQAVAISVIAEAVGVSARELTHPMNLLLAGGRIVRLGEKRGARYKVAPAKGAKQTARKRATKKRGASKRGASKRASRGATPGNDERREP